MTDIKRTLGKKIHLLLQSFPVVAVIGPRQSGKSTIARQVRPDWKFFDLESAADFDLIDRDIGFFFDNYSEKIVIDEAQMLPGLFRELRSVVDKSRKKANRFLITGSSSPELLDQVSESLAGRVAIVELAPFSIGELNKCAPSPFFEVFEKKFSGKTAERLFQLQRRFSDAAVMYSFLHGGYPEPALKGKRRPDFFHQWYDNYISTYVNRDVRRLFPRLDLPKYQRFIRTLAFLSGTIVNKAEIAGQLFLAESTLADYLAIAEGTFLWRNLPSFESNRFKSTIKSSRGHLRDSGLRHFLLKIPDRDSLLAHPLAGTSFESLVIEELLRNLSFLNIPAISPYHFRTKNGAEIDLIIEGHFGLLPIEIKLGVVTSKKKFTSLRHFIDEYELPFGLIINNGKDVRYLDKNIIQLPLSFL